MCKLRRTGKISEAPIYRFQGGRSNLGSVSPILAHLLFNYHILSRTDLGLPKSDECP